MISAAVKPARWTKTPLQVGSDSISTDICTVHCTLSLWILIMCAWIKTAFLFRLFSICDAHKIKSSLSLVSWIIPWLDDIVDHQLGTLVSRSIKSKAANTAKLTQKQKLTNYKNKQTNEQDDNDDNKSTLTTSINNNNNNSQ